MAALALAILAAGWGLERGADPSAAGRSALSDRRPSARRIVPPSPFQVAVAMIPSARFTSEPDDSPTRPGAEATATPDAPPALATPAEIGSSRIASVRPAA
jgi:hypothetical protein